MSSFLSLVAVVTCLASAPVDGSVELGPDRWRALRGDASSDSPRPWAATRNVRLEPGVGGVKIRARWEIRALRPGVFVDRILPTTALVETVTWDGKDAALLAHDDGWLIYGTVDDRVVVTVEAFLPGDPGRGGFPIDLMPAVTGRLMLAEGASSTLVEPSASGSTRPVLREGAAFLSGAERLWLEVEPPVDDEGDTLAVAKVGLGLTIGDAEVKGRAHLRWEVRRGSLERVAFRWSGPTSDLAVEGLAVGSWRVDGDRIAIELDAPVDDVVAVHLRWTEALPPEDEARVPLPRIEPLDAFRTESSLQVARDGDRDVDASAGGWDPVVPTAIAPWGEGLVEGTVTASYVRAGAGYDGRGRLDLFRFTPVAGPALVVDVADYAIAASEEGRVLMRARYEVTNERAAHLVVTPPPGFRLVAVDVAGEPVRPSADRGRWRVPLPRSLETVDGLLTVPVVLAFLGEASTSPRRWRDEIALPVVDAPTTVARLSLHLPRHYRSRLRPGEGPVVDAFTRGETVAFGLHDERSIARADALYRDAVDAWNQNDFERTRERLAALEALGGRSENLSKLRSNVAVVLGPEPREVIEPGKAFTVEGVNVSSPVSAKASPASRRIRAQARARASAKRQEQRKRKDKAKALEQAGDYAAAAEEYRSALEVTRDLGRLEDEDSVVYDFEHDEIQGKLAEVEAAAAARRALEGGPVPQREAPPPDTASTEAPRFEAPAGDDGELDLVSSDLRTLAALGEPFPSFGPVEARPGASSQPTRPLAARVIVPVVGETVRYQFLLLERGAKRTVRIDARRRSSPNRK